MIQDDVFDLIPGVCCCCWIAPALLVILPAVIVGMVKRGWRLRGLKAGQLYCAGCRYDLRGGAGMACPECGQPLTDQGIYQAGLDPPQDAATNGLMAFILAVAPVFVAGYVLLAINPYNYQRSTQVWLRTPMSTQVDELSIFIATERGRWHDGVIEYEIWLNGPEDRRSWSIEPGQDPSSVFTAAAFDRKMRAVGVDFVDAKDQENHRDQLVRAVEQLDASGTMPPTLNTPMKITYRTRLKFVPGSIQVILVIIGGIVVLAYVLQWALRYSETQRRVYHEKRCAVAERYRRQVERNAASSDRPGMT